MNQEQLLYEQLQKLNISYEVVEHPAVFTVEEALALVKIPGPWCKNLFLKDSKKRFWLIVALADTPIQLRYWAKKLSAPELRFAQPAALQEILQVEPGSVTPFALINDASHQVNVILDNALFNHKIIGFHPLRNTATVLLRPQDLLKFISSTGNPFQQLDFAESQ